MVRRKEKETANAQDAITQQTILNMYCWARESEPTRFGKKHGRGQHVGDHRRHRTKGTAGGTDGKHRKGNGETRKDRMAKYIEMISGHGLGRRTTTVV